MRSEAVERSTLNQRRQPDAWFQRSANRPFGLSRKKTNSAHSASLSEAGSFGRATWAWPP